jgi:hypothetical protein
LSGEHGRVTLIALVCEANWPTLWFLGLGLVLGRILLSWLPAGEPGRHSMRGLPITLATSLWLGSSSLWILRGWVPDAVVVGGATILGLLRLATLPASIVPTRALGSERGRALDRALLLLALASAAGLPWIAGLGAGVPRLVLAAFGASTVLFLEHGLAQARRAPFGRRCFVLAAALLTVGLCLRAREPLELGGEFAFAMSLCGGAAFGIGWLRRGDRRAGALAALCLANAGLWSALDGRVLGLTAAACLIARTSASARRWIAGWSAAGWLIALLAAFPHPVWIGPTDLFLTPVFNALMLLVLAGLAGALALLAWVLRAAAARRRPEPLEDRENQGRGTWFLALLFAATGALSSLLLASLIQASSLHERAWFAGSPLIAYAPLALLLAGCLSVRPERAR